MGSLTSVSGEGRRERGEKVLVCVCKYMSVCYVRRGKRNRVTSWAQMSGLSGIKFMTIDWSCVCVRVLDVDECVCLFGSWWNLTGVRSHHIKPIMDKQANETDESHEMS